MSVRSALGAGLALCATLAGLGCGNRLVGRVPRDGSLPETGTDARVDAPADAPRDAGADAPSDARADAGTDARADAGTDARTDAATDAHTDAGNRPPPPPPPDLPTVCTAEGWCWTHPLPSGDRFVDAFQVGPDDVWLVGAAGTIVRLNGGQLSAIPSPSDGIAALWASASNDVWAGGPTGPYHWDGAEWSQPGITTAPNLRGVSALWGCGPKDIWAVGGIATHWDGTTWTGVTVPSDAIITDGGFRAVWGSACNDVWAGSLSDASGMGAIYHYDGSVWTKVETRPAQQLAGVGKSDVWSLAQGRLFHSNGVDPGTLVSEGIVSLFPAGPDQVGIMNDARQISLLGAGGLTMAIPAAAPDLTGTARGWAADDLWALGASGTADHWNGTAWSSPLPAWSLGRGDATRVTGGGPNDLWAAVGGALWRGDGTSWHVELQAADVGGQIADLWAPGPDEVWVLGGDNLVHRLVAGAWSTLNPLAGDGTMPRLRAISGTSSNDVWILRGTNNLLHWDGSGWVSRDVLLYFGGGVNAVAAIWAAAPNDVWAVGDGISHFLNGAWVAPPQFPSSVTGIGGPYLAVSGTGPNDVHFLLASGYVVAATAGTLVEELNAAGSHPLALTAAVPTGVWAMFDDAAFGVSRLFRLGGNPDAGTSWTAGPVAPTGLAALWSAPDGTLWAAGAGGSLLRRAPTP
jgi:hypothetical protein